MTQRTASEATRTSIRVGEPGSSGDLPVLVVGAGVAGLATANALARVGVACELIECEPTWAQAGTGIYLPGNAARALRALGLENEVAERAVPIRRQRFSDEHGRLLFEADVEQLWNGVGPCLALHRADLHSVLLAGAAGAPIRMGVSVRALDQRQAEVAVELDDGSTSRYQLVVGADGIHSTVRHLAFGEVAGARPVGQLGWRFVTACPDEVTTWSVMLGHRTAFLTIPIGNGNVYCYCDVLAGEDTRDEDLGSLFAGFAAPVPGLLDSVERRTVHGSAIEEVALESWVRGRVALIGDAAHATSPNMAEGAALALEDALVLADCLHDGRPVPAALSAFEARRRPRTEWVRAQTHRRDRTRYLPARVRNLVLRAFGRRIFRSNYRPLLDDA
jgi:FAD-dependent urate hydroxylase